jgi:hypothetical protein
MHQLHSFPLCPSLARVANITIVDGTAWRTAPLYVHTSFTLRVTSLLPGLANDTVMQARLHGTTILAADVQPVPDPGGGHGLYRVSYTLRDPGEYRLQLRMLWLSGASATFTPIPRLVREFLRSSVYVDCVFFNESIAVANNHVWDPVYHRADQVRFPSCESGVSRVSLSPRSSTHWVCAAAVHVGIAARAMGARAADGRLPPLGVLRLPRRRRRPHGPLPLQRRVRMSLLHVVGLLVCWRW